MMGRKLESVQHPLSLGMKLFLSLEVLAQVFHYLLLDGSRQKRPCRGWVGSPTIFVALWASLLWVVMREGSEAPMKFSTPLTVCWRCFWSQTVQPPSHTVMQLVETDLMLKGS